MTANELKHNDGIATFGAGCFWGVEQRFRELPGVTEATSGYMGGAIQEPTYRGVCSGNTGHAEVVQVRFDPDKLAYETLLTLFFDMHNPTTINRQGPDIGSQYRSVVFFHDDDQHRAAREAIIELERSGRWSQPVVTQVVAADTFWRAEEYHQRYLEKNGLGMCAI